MAKKSADPASCPRCLSDNDCAIAAGASVQACWCYGRKLSAAALAALPAEQQGQVCLCHVCALAEGEPHLER